MLLELKTLPSTNDYLLERLELYPEGSGVFTTHQTQGKGRRGNRWREQPGENLALSLVYHGVAVEHLSVLPLVVGLAVRETMFALGCDVFLKWSNDIIACEKKLGGILCESRLWGRQASVVVGIGINLLGDTAALDGRGLPQAISLAGLGVFPSPDQLAEKLAEAVTSYLRRLQQEGFLPSLHAAYTAACLTLGREIRLVRTDNIQATEQYGRAVGISPQGELLCEIDGRQQVFSSGAVAVRGKQGYL